MPVPFVHLHVHSEYSLLDGVSRIPKLVARARELGMDSLALTDHGAMYGAIEFYQEAKKQGIKPLIGCEVYVAPNSRLDRRGRADSTSYHLLLLARNAQGYRNLLKLVTRAHLEGYYYKPRVDRELLAAHSEGLICTSACPSGELARHIREGDMAGAREVAGWHREVFGEHYYVELQEHGIPDMAGLNDGLKAVARDLGIKLVVTNDTHYVLPEDSFAQELLVCIQTNTTLDDPNRLNMNEHGNTFYLRSPAEMAALFPNDPEALENTAAIAAACQLDLQFGRVQLPDFPVPEGHDADSWLAHLCWEGLKRRYDPVPDEAVERLKHELDVVQQTGFATYILIVADFVRHAREQRIFFGPRGSAAGSMICYTLGIADVEPLANKLLFERFLNIERREMPDIDMDFADDRRGEMIEYAVRKYGRDRVAQIITFGTLGARAAIRDVGRAMGLDYATPDRVAKLIPALPVGVKIDDALEQVGELKQSYQSDEQIKRLIDAARKLEGIARHASTHAAGVVISAQPLDEVVPLQPIRTRDQGRTKDDGPRTKEEDAASLGPSSSVLGLSSSVPGPWSGGVMTQYDMNIVAKVGLLKMDFLGLANLTIIGRCLEYVRARHGVDIDIARIPLDDANVYAHLAEGETTGIFQFEGPMMRKYLKELRPTCIGDLAAMVALYRPGPMEHIPRFIRSKHGLERVEYLHPVLEPILEDTYGIIVYQEQVLQIAQAVAGYSLAQADILRKAMGKKIPEEMRKQKAFFLDGAEAKGFSRELANAIWELVEPFAGYGFNRAHACCYALVAYQTAYLKVNYTVEYMTAVLSTHMGDTEKVAVTVAECRRLGIDVLGPDVNRSAVDFSIDEAPGRPPAIRFGLGAVKNVGGAAAAEIVAARQAGEGTADRGPRTEDQGPRTKDRGGGRGLPWSFVLGPWSVVRRPWSSLRLAGRLLPPDQPAAAEQAGAGEPDEGRGDGLARAARAAAGRVGYGAGSGPARVQGAAGGADLALRPRARGRRRRFGGVELARHRAAAGRRGVAEAGAPLGKGAAGRLHRRAPDGPRRAGADAAHHRLHRPGHAGAGGPEGDDGGAGDGCAHAHHQEERHDGGGATGGHARHGRGRRLPEDLRADARPLAAGRDPDRRGQGGRAQRAPPGDL